LLEPTLALKIEKDFSGSGRGDPLKMATVPNFSWKWLGIVGEVRTIYNAK
jgi:hypothetical protein